MADETKVRKPLDTFPMPTLQDVLTNACQLIDSVKMEWQSDGSWSEWDQAVRDALSRELLKTCEGGRNDR